MRSQASNKQTLLPWQQECCDPQKGNFCASPWAPNCMQNLKGGLKIFSSQDVWFLQRLVLKTIDAVNLCLKNVANDVTVTITAQVLPMICSPLNYLAVEFAGKNHAHLKDIALSECISEVISCRRHSHWSRSELKRCKWRGQKKSDWTCCNEHKI